MKTTITIDFIFSGLTLKDVFALGTPEVSDKSKILKDDLVRATKYPTKYWPGSFPTTTEDWEVYYNIVPNVLAFDVAAHIEQKIEPVLNKLWEKQKQDYLMLQSDASDVAKIRALAPPKYKLESLEESLCVISEPPPGNHIGNCRVRFDGIQNHNFIWSVSAKGTIYQYQLDCRILYELGGKK